MPNLVLHLLLQVFLHFLRPLEMQILLRLASPQEFVKEQAVTLAAYHIIIA